jgi:hypothetical protein
VGLIETFPSAEQKQRRARIEQSLVGLQDTIKHTSSTSQELQKEREERKQAEKGKL